MEPNFTHSKQAKICFIAITILFGASLGLLLVGFVNPDFIKLPLTGWQSSSVITSLEDETTSTEPTADEPAEPNAANEDQAEAKTASDPEAAKPVYDPATNGYGNIVTSAAPLPAPLTSSITENTGHITDLYRKLTTVFQQLLNSPGTSHSTITEKEEVVIKEILTIQGRGTGESINSLQRAISESIGTDSLTVSGDGTITGLLTLDNALYLADITAPANTDNRLYSTGGSLYWAGVAIGGASIGQWETDGTNVYRVGGNVGIGTTSPFAFTQLHVRDDGDTTVAIDAGGQSRLSWFTDLTSTGKQWHITNEANAGRLSFSVADDRFDTNFQTNMVLTDDGLLGLGDRSPDFGMEVTASSTGGYFAISSAADNDGDIFIIDSVGNVGIGTTSPSSLLDVAGKITLSGNPTGNGSIARAATTGYLQIVGSSETSNGAGIYLAGNDYVGGSTLGAGDAAIVTKGATSDIRFQNGSTDLVIIDESGSVGIGTTSPTADLEILRTEAGSTLRLGRDDTNITSADQLFGALEFWGNDSTNGPGVVASIAASSTGSAGWADLTFSTMTNLERMRLHDSGGLSLGYTGIANDPGAGNMIISGNVGIGTTSPSGMLHVYQGGFNNTYSGTTIAGDNTVIEHVGASGTNEQFAELAFRTTGTAGQGQAAISAVQRINNRNDTNLTFQVTENSAGVFEAMRIQYDGNVGIGTTSPEHTLTVNGTISAGTTTAPIYDTGGQVCNVKAYGAVGDNSTDNYDAIVAAINACPEGGTVLFPMGEYRISQGIVLDKPVTLMGVYSPRWSYSSTPRSSIRADFSTFPSSTPIIHVRDRTISGESDDNNGGRIINLGIDGGSAATDVTGIYFEGLVRDWKITDVDISQTTGNGFEAAVGAGSGNPRGFTIRGLSIYSPDGHGFRATALNDSYLEDVLVVGGALRGFYLSSMGETKVNNSRAAFNALEGLYIDGSSNNGGLQFTDFSTDRNDRHGVRISSTGTTTVTFNGLLTRRDGANDGGGSETPYAGLAVIGTTSIDVAPVIVNNLTQIIGVNDSGTGTLAPTVGVRVTNASYVNVEGQLWGVNDAYQDGGGNGHFIIAEDSIIKTGSDWSNVTPPLYNNKWVATTTNNLIYDGKISIGSSTGDRLLNIVSPNSPGARFQDTTNNVIFDMRAEDFQGFFGTFSNHDLRFQTNNTSRLTIDTSGNVGIGTTSPEALLEVSAGTNNAALIGQVNLSLGLADSSSALAFRRSSDGGLGAGIRAFNDTGGSMSLAIKARNDIAFFGNVSETVRFTEAGNVGIGTTTPVAKLDLVAANVAVGENSGNIDVHTSDAQATDIGGSLSLGGLYDGGSSALTFGKISGRKENSTSGNWSGYLQFATRQFGGTLAERMRIDSSGNVGIGTTTPQAELEVASVDPQLRLTDSNSAGSAAQAWLGFHATDGRIGYVGAGSTGDQHIYLVSDNGDITIIGTGGSCTLTGAASGGTCFSDERLKEVEGTVTNTLDKLSTLELKTFYWNDLANETTNASTTIENTGFLAQNVEAAFPELVHTDASGYKRLDYGTLSMYGLVAIKELNIKLEDIAATTLYADLADDSFTKRFFDRFIAWFSDTANGVGDFFANRVRTTQVCLSDDDGETCITKSHLDELLSDSDQTAAVIDSDDDNADNLDNSDDSRGDNSNDDSNDGDTDNSANDGSGNDDDGGSDDENGNNSDQDDADDQNGNINGGNNDANDDDADDNSGSEDDGNTDDIDDTSDPLTDDDSDENTDEESDDTSSNENENNDGGNSEEDNNNDNDDSDEDDADDGDGDNT